MSFNLSPTGDALHLKHYLFLPFYVAMSKNSFYSEYDLRDMRLAVILLMAVVLVMRYFYRNFSLVNTARLTSEESVQSQETWRLVIVYCFTGYCCWLIEFSVYRYLLPLELMTGLLIVYMIKIFFRPEWLRQTLLIIIIAIFAVTTYYPHWGKVKYGEAYFSMATPRLPTNAVVLFLTQPLAYVIPFFSADTHFIGMPFVTLGAKISSNHLMFSPHGRLFQEVIDKVIKNPVKFPLYVMTIQKSGPLNIERATPITERNNKRILEILEHFDVVQDKLKCRSFKTNIGDMIELCPIKKEKMG